MSNSELVKMLSEGYTVKEIAVTAKEKTTTIAYQIYNLRESCNCKTVAHLVANFLRRGLIQ